MNARPEFFFKTPKAFAAWLAKNHSKSQGIWLRMYKKASGKPSITYDQALDEALCQGWIDGQKNSKDEQSWLQLFCPRRKLSGWSKRNTRHVQRLVRLGRMRARGLAEVAAAKKDGRWKAAYDSPGKSSAPKDFLRALGGDKKALEFYGSLNKTNLYAINYRLQSARTPETRQRRMRLILDMMAKGKKFH